MKSFKSFIAEEECKKTPGKKVSVGKNTVKINPDSDELKEKLGLWDRIHAKRKRGERPAKPGEKDYPKTLNVEGKEELKPRNKGEMQRKAGNLGREVVSTPNTKKNAAKRGAAMDRMKKLVSVIARDDEEKRFKTIGQSPLHNSYETEGDQLDEVAAWQRSEGKNKSGGLNEKGRKSYERDNPGSDLKAPSKKVGNPRRKSFCARMRGMKSKLTSAKTARDPDSRINKSLRAWNC